MRTTAKLYTIPLRLSRKENEALHFIASTYGNISLNAAVRKAIATECFLIEQRSKGSALIIEERGGLKKEIIIL